jgi:hypothetical protein
MQKSLEATKDEEALALSVHVFDAMRSRWDTYDIYEYGSKYGACDSAAVLRIVFASHHGMITRLQ